MDKAISLIIIVCVVQYVQASEELSVYMPKCAKQIVTKPIEYTIGNFGHIPYGQTLVGEIVFPKNQLLCNTSQQIEHPFAGVPKFEVIKRGDCKFTKKVIEAQKLNAELAIIFDNETSSKPRTLMINDGHGNLVDIPSIFISNEDGLLLKKAQQKCQGAILLKITFDTFEKQTANVTLWLDIDHRESFVMLRDFYASYKSIISSRVDFNLKFRVKQKCFVCEKSDCMIEDSLEICYLAPKQVQTTQSGVAILEQSLRSYFIFDEYKKKNNTNKWWEYMDKFDDLDCMDKKDLKVCSQDIMSDLGIDKVRIQSLVDENKQKIKQKKPQILKMFAEQASLNDVLVFPEVTVNNKNYYGLFKAQDIFKMICKSLIQPPSECLGVIEPDIINVGNPDTLFWQTVILIIVVMAVGFVVCLLIYTRIIRKQMRIQMSQDVNKMVENYVVLAEQKSQNRSDGKL